MLSHYDMKTMLPANNVQKMLITDTCVHFIYRQVTIYSISRLYSIGKFHFALSLYTSYRVTQTVIIIKTVDMIRRFSKELTVT